MTAAKSGPCTHWTPDRGACGAPDARPYLPGLRCPMHTPAALAGRTVPAPDPESTLEGLRRRKGLNPDAAPPAAHTAIDRAAVKSGKRRSTPDEYKRAKAETAGSR